MTVVTYPLGRPRAAALRGGDCRGRDLTQARNVHGPHRFAATTDAVICNGLLRLTIGAAGIAPTIAVEAYSGAVTSTVGDYFTDVFVDTFPGSTVTTTAAWVAMGTVTIDSPAVTAVLSAVQLVRVNPEVVILRLVAPAIGDAWLTLRGGFRAFSVQHGTTRPPVVSTTRRISWAGPPSLTGTYDSGRVVENSPPTVAGLVRFVAALDTIADAGAFSLTTSATGHARFGAGVATGGTLDTPSDHHAQLADASRPRLEVVSA